MDRRRYIFYVTSCVSSAWSYLKIVVVENSTVRQTANRAYCF